MKVMTRYGIGRIATLVVLAGTSLLASCSSAPGSLTGPSPATSPPGAHTQANRGQSSTAATDNVLLLTKKCDAIDHCSVVTAPAGPIPVGSDVNYFGPLLEARTTSKIVVTTPGGDTATGHCSVSYKTGEGTCVLSHGTGLLEGIHANLTVSSDFTEDPAGVFTWDGRFHFTPLPG